MRYGFFHGIGGDAAALAAARERLSDCDRIISLGDLLGAVPGAGDAACLELFGQALCLGGPSERRRAHDAALPVAIRAGLRGLPGATVVDGIAALGKGTLQPPSRREAQAVGGAPRLVAPLAVAAGQGATRLWRASGGLARVEELQGQVRIALGNDRLRLDLAPALQGEVVQVAVIDRVAGFLEVREARVAGRVASGGPAPRPARQAARRRRVPVGQQLLAV